MKPDSLRLEPGGSLRGRLRVPGDKSISHRAIMLGAIARGSSRITGFLEGEDCLGTLRCFQAMGVPIEGGGACWTVHGQGLEGLKEPTDVLDVGNSGTTLRLMLGILAGGVDFAALTGDASIRQRPMGRIVVPLRQMGAMIEGRAGGTLAPLAVRRAPLHAITYASPVASAQIKSAVLLAGLYAEGETVLSEPALSRDHTERMLSAMGVRIQREGTCLRMEGGQTPVAMDVAVPGDLSSAAFWLVGGAVVPGSELTVENVGINPSRTGLLEVLEAMGADVTRLATRDAAGEPVADLRVRYGGLRGTTLEGSLIPRLIDEIPVLALAAACAEGTTVIRDAQELRVKESDRLEAIALQLGRLGARIEELPDGLVIHGPTRWRGGSAASGGDHRMAMTLALAGVLAAAPLDLGEVACTATSYPGFWNQLADLRA